MSARFPEIDVLTEVLPALYLHMVKGVYIRIVMGQMLSDILPWLKTVVGRLEIVDLEIDGVESFAIHPFDAFAKV